MHEFGIAQEIVRVACEAAREHQAARVLEVRVRIGPLANVVADALQFAFGLCTEAGPAQGAALTIETVPLEIECRACGARTRPDGIAFQCEACGGHAVEIVAGRELEVQSVSVE